MAGCAGMPLLLAPESITRVLVLLPDSILKKLLSKIVMSMVPGSYIQILVNRGLITWRKTINWVYMSGYSLSLVALLLSIFILAYFRALHCTRNILHINLFASFSINNLLWLIWYLSVVPFPDVITDNGVWCQSLFIVTHYFMLTNYFWMLCEGFYLHSLLAFAFIMEEQLLKYVYVIGWAVPFIVIASYATLRIFNGDNRDCWIHESSYSHTLIIPVVISLCINLVFLVSILRVLLLKIKTNTSQGQNRNELIKVFRAAFVLVPLLGLHYMIILFRPENDPFWERSHEILSAVSASYQGLCVACLFCFLNNEVHVQIKRKWYQFRDIPSNQVFSTVTGSTYALERRATRSSQTAMIPQTNEVSPMLGEEKTSPFKSDERNNHIRLIDPSVNGIKNVVIRNKKSVSLVTDQNYKNKNFSNEDLTMLPMKKPLIGSNEKLYRESDSQIAEDYV
ncbi:secretin receptor-like isoform X2 [Planococcus citri]|uniref:secretin receptor-like isoform X2 n=1 Tax=Planococcus citri TaxID=170843 RepID=UPI0031F9BFB8